MTVSAESSFFKNIFYIFLALLAFCLFLSRMQMYDVNGLPKTTLETTQTGDRIIGENLAGDYAVINLLKDGNDASYHAENQTKYVNETLKSQGTFFSGLSPVAAMILTPIKRLPYTDFYYKWLFFGIFFYGLALYMMFPLKKAVYFMFATPVLFVVASTGGWGLFAAAGTIFILSLSAKHEKFIGFLLGLTIVQPVLFAILAVLLWMRREKKALYVGLGMAVFLLLATGFKYGFTVFGQAFLGELAFINKNPAAFISVYSTLIANGIGKITAVFGQICVSAIAIYWLTVTLQHRNNTAVQNAAVCCAFLAVFPFAWNSLYALMSVAVLFLLQNGFQRGFVEHEKALLISCLFLPFVDAYFIRNYGISIQLACLPIVMWQCSKAT